MKFWTFSPVLQLILCTSVVSLVNGIFKENIAINKNVKQSSTYTDPDVWSASNAVDGNKNCSHVDKDHYSLTTNEAVPWWQVDLGNIYSLSNIIVHGRPNEQPVLLKGFEVYLSTSAISTNKKNVYTNTAYANKGIFTIPVQPNVSARYVRIEMPGTYRNPTGPEGPLALCEVEVYPKDIIKDSKNPVITSMSRKNTYYETSLHWDKDRAIDGVRQFNPDTCGCCSATSGTEIPWWKLDLTKPYLIAEVMIYGRSDNGVKVQSENLSVYGSNSTTENGTELYNGNPNRYNTVYSISLQPLRLFQVLTIRRWTISLMTICEVKMFQAGCADGSFGDKCLGRCNCKNGMACYVNTGHCDSCPLGYIGDSCQTPCDEGKYGKNCSESCSGHCNNGNQQCNKTNGYCMQGCADGYEGIRCEKVCPQSTYGQNCTKTCNTCTQMKCENTNGLCTFGCIPGFKPNDRYCKEACDEGKYGQNCSESCSGHCYNGNQQCNKTNGNCMQGCADGYEGIRCEKACDEGKYGQNCSESCSGHCNNGNQQCNKRNGNCMQGCADGYEGVRCEKDNNILYRLRYEIKTSMSTVAGNWTSNRAVDGNTGPDPNTCQCCSGTTNAPLSWWMVDLGERVPVNGIAIYSRNNENDNRQLQGFQVILSANNSYNASAFMSKSLGMFSKMYVIKLKDILTRYIKIQRPGILTLCEVKVFQGVCEQGKFGHECARECHCGDNKPCNQLTGNCQSTACKPGWQGPSCNETCPPETFGDNCSDSCYCAEGTCTNNYGICPGICRQGYHGAHCNQVGSEVKSDTTVLLGVVGSTGAFLVVAVIIGIVVLMLRRRGRESVKSEYETPNRRASPTEIQEYDTIANITDSSVSARHDYENENVTGL